MSINTNASVAMLDGIFLRMPMGVAHFDCDGRLTRCNPTWQEYVGDVGMLLPESDIVGLSLFQQLPGNEETLQHFFQSALAGNAIDRDAVRFTVDDETFYWDIASIPAPTAEGEPGVLLVVADVTQRVQSRRWLERQVQDRTRRLSALYEVMAVASEAPNLSIMLHRLLPRVLAAVRSNGGAIMLIRGSTRTMELAADSGLPEGFPVRLDDIEPQQLFSLWDEWLGLDEGDLDTTTWPLAPKLRASKGACYLTVPISANEACLGLLIVTRVRRRIFNQDDIALLNSVADQIGIAIENIRLRLAQERLAILEERNRLARELHDSVTQSLYSLTLFAEAGRRHAKAGNSDQAMAFLERLGETGQQALKEMRLLVHKLRPAVLVQEGLHGALQHRLNAVERRAGVTATLTIEPGLNLQPALEDAIYYIAQEALNNALKHAHASSVWVTVHKDKSGLVILEVQDNGSGFDPVLANAGGGFGLVSMRERAERFQGSIEIESNALNGATIRAILRSGPGKGSSRGEPDGRE